MARASNNLVFTNIACLRSAHIPFRELAFAMGQSCRFIPHRAQLSYRHTRPQGHAKAGLSD